MPIDPLNALNAILRAEAARTRDASSPAKRPAVQRSAAQRPAATPPADAGNAADELRPARPSTRRPAASSS